MSSFRVAIILGILLVMLNQLCNYFSNLPPQMNGNSSMQFKPAVTEYRKLIQSNLDMGSSFSVYLDDNVINLVGGYMDTRFHLPWTTETLTQGFSLSLVSIPIVFASLFQRKLLNPDDLVVNYLPRFVAGNVTIADLLRHRAGFPHFMQCIHLEQWRDFAEAITSSISHQVPTIQPGTQATHLHSLALLADAIVRKVDPKRRTLAHYFAQEIAWPLGLDLVIGVPRSQLYRVARTYHAGLKKVLSALLYADINYLWTNLITGAHLFQDTVRNKALDLFCDYKWIYNWHPDMLEVPLASSHLFSNAQSLARLFSALVNFDRKPADDALKSNRSWPLTESTVSWMLHLDDSYAVSPPYDPVANRRIAYSASGLAVRQSPKGTKIFGMWDDIMGQGVFMDPVYRLSWAYTTNHAHGRSLNRDYILNSLLDAVYGCLPDK